MTVDGREITVDGKRSKGQKIQMRNICSNKAIKNSSNLE